MRSSARWARRTAWGFPVADLILAAAFCLISGISAGTGNPDEGPWWLTVPVALTMSAALAWRVRNGIVAMSLVMIAGLTQTIWSMAPSSLWSLAVYAIIIYSLAATYREFTAAVVGAVMVALLLVQERISNGVDYLFVVTLFGGIWLLGRASQVWRGRVSTAERLQLETARLAVAEERLRIARELHDVVAHSLSVIAVQSDAAAAALERNPALAAAPVTAIGSTARGALDEIRQLLDLLRSEEPDRNANDYPGMAAVGGLVAAALEAGVPVEYESNLTATPLSPAVDLAAYRAIQEGLTNVIKHSGRAKTRVTVDQSSSQLRVRVDNGPPPPGTVEATDGERSLGYGLIGIRERVASLGGELDCGPLPDGGFRLELRVPVGQHGGPR